MQSRRKTDTMPHASRSAVQLLVEDRKGCVRYDYQYIDIIISCRSSWRKTDTIPHASCSNSMFIQLVEDRKGCVRVSDELEISFPIHGPMHTVVVDCTISRRDQYTVSE